MPALLRRRLDPLGRMAAQVAYWCWPAQSLGLPVVFASRYGDAARSVAMLADLAAQQPLSPTAFGMSVHNAAAALVSIARGDRANTLAVSAGAASAGAALLEALALLADGAPEVLVVCYDAPLPCDYAAFADENAAPYAWAWRVARPDGAEPHRSLVCGPAPQQPGSAHAALPFGLDLLCWGLSAPGHWTRHAGHTWWDGRCHD